MAAALIKHEQITTTTAKAKELRPYVEKLITLAKHGGLSNRRLAQSRLMDDTQLVKLFDVLAKRYADRNGGYTRIIKAGIRASDAAPISIIEFVDRDVCGQGPGQRPGHDRGRVRSRSEKGCRPFLLNSEARGCYRSGRAFSLRAGEGFSCVGVCCLSLLLTSACAMTPNPEIEAAAAADAAAMAAPPAADAAPAQPALAYPQTRRADLVEPQFGVQVADPYRWLENDVRNDAEVKSWVDAQNVVTNQFLGTLPGREALEQRITRALRLRALRRADQKGRPLLLRAQQRASEPVRALRPRQP